MPWGIELGALVVTVLWVASGLRFPEGRRARMEDFGLVALGTVLVEVVLSRGSGLVTTSASAVLAPGGLALGPLVLRAALLTATLAPRSSTAPSRLVWLAVLIDLSALELLGAVSGLRRWEEPGPLGFPAMVPLAWLVGAVALATVLRRWRWLAPLGLALSTVAAAVALWGSLFRWLPYPSALALALAPALPLLAGAGALWLLVRTSVSAVRRFRRRHSADDATGAAMARLHPLLALVACGACFVVVSALPPPSTPRRPLEVAPSFDERSLVLVGDVMLGRGVAERVAPRGSFDPYFDATRPWLTSADVTFGNLESVIADGGTRKERGIAFRAPPRSADALARAGFDVLSMANNHVADFGMEALQDSHATVSAAGIRPVGVGPTGAPQEPVIVERAGHRFGFLAYCDPRAVNGCTHWDRKLPWRAYRATEQALRRDVAALRPQVDTLVVSLHWGTESVPEPDLTQAALARRLIDLGVDVVAGHHAHVHQRAERYRHGVILYSMGNFVFDQHSSARFREAGLYRVIVGPEGVRRAELIPVRYRAREWMPEPVEPAWIEIAPRSRLPVHRQPR